jgi:mannose/fructose-specific phosphotransferase system component IIA
VGGKKMRQVIVATHGGLSKGLQSTLSMIVGQNVAETIVTYSLQPGMDATDFTVAIKKEMDSRIDYVILTDILGGSVDNALSTLLEYDNVWLISGVNLIMLLEIVLSENPNTNDVCQNALENAKSGMNLRKTVVVFNGDEEF